MDFIESDCLELKEVINNDFKKEIIAFANTNGGEIYIYINLSPISISKCYNFFFKVIINYFL